MTLISQYFADARHSCGGILTSTPGEISYNVDSENRATNCIWVIAANENHLIAIEFKHITAETGNNYTYNSVQVFTLLYPVVSSLLYFNLM